MITRAPFAVAFLTLAACGPSQAPPNKNAAPAVDALLGARDQGDLGALLTDDAIVVDGDVRATGSSAVVHIASVVGDLELASGVDSHHDVLRALVKRDGDDAMLFGGLEGERLKFVVLLDSPKKGELAGDTKLEKYGDSWNEGDAEKRDALLADCWSKDGRYVDPSADVTGRDELSAHIDEFRGSLPGAAVTPASKLASGDRAVHFRWLTTGLAGVVSIEGMDVGLLDEDHKLTLIAGFFNALPEK